MVVLFFILLLLLLLLLLSFIHSFSMKGPLQSALITCVKDSVKNEGMCNNNLALIEALVTYPNMPKILKGTFLEWLKPFVQPRKF